MNVREVARLLREAWAGTLGPELARERAGNAAMGLEAFWSWEGIAGHLATSLYVLHREDYVERYGPTWGQHIQECIRHGVEALQRAGYDPEEEYKCVE